MSAKDRAAREALHRAAMKVRAAQKAQPAPAQEPKADRAEPVLKQALSSRRASHSEPKQGPSEPLPGHGLFGSPRRPE